MNRLALLLLIATAGCGSTPRAVQVDDGVVAAMKATEEQVRRRCARHGRGRVTLRLEVGNLGRIDRTTLVENTGKRKLGFCAMAACAEARFDPGPPFVFDYTFDPEVATRRAMKVSGALAPDVVWQGVNTRAAEIDACMDAHGAHGQRGEITVGFSIHGTGAVRGARMLASTLGNESIERCVLDRVSRLAFPEPEGNGFVDVRYTYFLEKTATSKGKKKPRPSRTVKTPKPPRLEREPPPADAPRETWRPPVTPLDGNPYTVHAEPDGGSPGDF